MEAVLDLLPQAHVAKRGLHDRLDLIAEAGGRLDEAHRTLAGRIGGPEPGREGMARSCGTTTPFGCPVLPTGELDVGGPAHVVGIVRIARAVRGEPLVADGKGVKRAAPAGARAEQLRVEQEARVQAPLRHLDLTKKSVDVREAVRRGGRPRPRADRHDDGVDGGEVLQDLERVRADARDELGLGGAHEAGAAPPPAPTRGARRSRGLAPPPPPRAAASRRTSPGSPSGTATQTGVDVSRPANGIDWPWLTVDAVTRLARRASSPRWAARFTPPRTLNTPAAWWFSCLT